MKKKNGFLLTELLISFSLSFVILLVIFNTTISLNQKLSDLFIENKAYSQQIVFNRKIADDMAFQKVTGIDENNEGTTTKTIKIIYENGSNKELIIYYGDEPSITYNNEKILIGSNMKVNFTNNAVTCTEVGGKYLLKLNIPIYYVRNSKNFGIELYNIVDSDLCL